MHPPASRGGILEPRAGEGEERRGKRRGEERGEERREERGERREERRGEERSGVELQPMAGEEMS